MGFVNYYNVLQVQPNAEKEVLDSASATLLRKYESQPDKVSDLFEAYNVLSDSDLRKKFDEELRERETKNIGPYKIVKKLAEGGFGAVYVAKHSLLDELTVIKHALKISGYDTELLKKEARAIWDLRHHAIPAMRDFIILPDGSCCLVMSYIPGPTLQHVIDRYRKKKKEIDPENVCWIIERILDALRYIHYHGVVHGDIKPLNIIVQPELHTCYVVDFGLASIRPDRETRPEGYTPMFAPPEINQEAPLLPESDLYCLGLVALYAFGGDPINKRIPAHIPIPVRDFIEKLLIYDIRNRPSWSEVDLVNEFREIRQKAFGRSQTNFKKLEIP